MKKQAPRKSAGVASDPAEQAILDAVRRIPKGKVSTYGDIARVAGLPGRARLVGTVLKQTAANVPWQRVINAAGRSSFPERSDAWQRQLALLKREGVHVIGGRVDLDEFGWPPREEDLDRVLWGES